MRKGDEYLYLAIVVNHLDLSEIISDKRKENIMKSRSNHQKVESITIRVSPDLKGEIRQSAKAAGQTMSTYMINKCLGIDYGFNVIVHRTDIFNQLDVLKKMYSDDEESMKIIDNIAGMIGGFEHYADH
jgi:hypothetical protein